MFKSISLVYIALLILIFITTYIYLNKYNADKKSKYITLGLLLLITIITFNHFNGLIKTIFSLKYLSVRTYLFLVVIVNCIILYTLNHKVKLIYKIYNYILFITSTIIFGASLSIILGNKIKAFYIMDISNAVSLIDLSIVLFIIYLIFILLTNIGFYIFEPKVLEKEIDYLKEIKNKLSNIKLKKKKDDILTKEELLNYDKEELYINGVECSIIFEDSNKENIFKNYHILLDNINNKLVNGYTLEENKLLKNICMKLKIGNLRNIDINNNSILNMISAEEYNLLKKIL